MKFVPMIYHGSTLDEHHAAAPGPAEAGPYDSRTRAIELEPVDSADVERTSMAIIYWPRQRRGQ